MISTRDRLILRTVRQAGETSRARLIQQTGLSGVAIFRSTTDLAARGLIEIGDAVIEGRGQPSNLVRIRHDARIALGISIQHDHAEAVIVDLAGRILATRIVRIAGMARDIVIPDICLFVEETLIAHGLQRACLIGAGLAVAGFFVDDGNRINPASGLDDWALIDLCAALEPVLGVPVVVENIANAAALGERLLGCGQRYQSFAYLNFAHGLGAGIVANGAILRGRQGNAGEIGGLFDIAGLPSPALGSLWQHLKDIGRNLHSIDDLVAQFDPNWPGVSQWVDFHGSAMSFIANALRYTLDCEAIVLGGMIPPSLAEQLMAQIVWRDQTLPPRRGVGWEVPDLVIAEVREHAAAVGVASFLLARDYFD